MAKTDFKSVDEYIAARPEAVRPVLRRVRAIIRKALPGAQEVISYQIPAYRKHGGTVVYFAGWKEHYSLYPVGEKVVAALGDALAPYEKSKGTIRFPLAKPIPAALIARIVKLLEKQATERAKSKTAKPAKRAKKAQAGR